MERESNHIWIKMYLNQYILSSHRTTNNTRNESGMMCGASGVFWIWWWGESVIVRAEMVTSDKTCRYLPNRYHTTMYEDYSNSFEHSNSLEHSDGFEYLNSFKYPGRPYEKPKIPLQYTKTRRRKNQSIGELSTPAELRESLRDVWDNQVLFRARNATK